MTVGDGFAAGRANLLHHGVGRSRVGITGDLGIPADIVYHDTGAARSEQEGIGPAEARSAASARDDRGATIQTELGQLVPPSLVGLRPDWRCAPVPADHCR